jgi:hypothetical protein
MMKEKFRLTRVAVTRLSTAFLVICFIYAPLLAGDLPRFEDYGAPFYGEAIHPPKWIRHIGGDGWRDNLGKLVGPPEINFAGKYFIAVHSCGTGCRYYTLTDLSTGSDLDLLKMFAAAEPSPKTRDGRGYITELFSRPDSRVLVAQYHIGLNHGDEECRERVFLFESGKLEPVTNTRRVCRKF